jgi:acyl dehydratase
MTDASRPPVHAIVVGDTLSGRPLTLTLARVLAFSGGPIDAPGWPQRNLHTDLASARAAGLDHIIASGTQSEGLLIGFLGDVVGPDWYATGDLDVRFLKPVAVDSVVRPGLRLTAKAPDAGRLRLTFECWCATEDAARVIEGTATCTVAAAAAATPRS